MIRSTLAPHRWITFWSSAGTWSRAPSKQFGVLDRWPRWSQTRPALWSDTFHIRPVGCREWNWIRIESRENGRTYSVLICITILLQTHILRYSFGLLKSCWARTAHVFRNVFRTFCKFRIVYWENTFFIWENTVENVVCKISAMLFVPRCTKFFCCQYFKKILLALGCIRRM